MSDFWKATVAVVLGAVLVVAVAWAFVAWETIQCDSKWPDIEHRYDIPAGCMVHSEQGWIPDYRFRAFD